MIDQPTIDPVVQFIVPLTVRLALPLKAPADKSRPATVVSASTLTVTYVTQQVP